LFQYGVAQAVIHGYEKNILQNYIIVRDKKEKIKK
jgi:hypothetical protein